MSTTRHLDPKDVPAHLRLDYTGRRFEAVLTDSHVIPATAGLWDGGSRDTYTAVNLRTGAATTMAAPDPFAGGLKDQRVTIPRGAALVRRTVFQGRDLGLTYYLHPDDAAPLLPAPSDLDLSREAHIVLALANGYVSSYRREAAAREGINANTYDRLRENLATLGLMKASGAITTAGKNHLATLPRVAGL